ncbi:MAG: hypothetical protein WC262_09535 [Bacteroidales bacterium]|jgi:hypothetical protein
METVYEFSIDNRMRAVLSVKYPEKQVTKSGRVEHIPVRVTIPDECVLQTPAIRLDETGKLLFGSDNVYRPVLDDVGRPKIDTGMYPDGSVHRYSCEVETKTVSIESMVSDQIDELIITGQLVEPIDLTPVFAQILAWETIINDAQSLVDAAEEQRAALYAEQERQKKIESEILVEQRRQEEAEQKAVQQKKATVDAERAARRKAWIKAFGSDMAKASVERGYECRSRFLKEWANVTLGDGYILDFKGEADTQIRNCPSDRAIAEILRLESLNVYDPINDVPVNISQTVVWLPNGGAEINDRWDERDPCEAVEVILHDPYFDRNYYFYKKFW